jgi:hypothetical protein
MTKPPIDLVSLLPELDEKLLILLKSLSPQEWQEQTIAKLWKVKDAVAHLLDGNIRTLSMLRDRYYENTPQVQSYQELLNYLNGLNADWIKAMKRVSPQMLILLHEITGPLYCWYYAYLDPFDISPFPVSWAGESESRNWMHIAREYTEKWLHQQQIRDAVNKPGIMNRKYFYPFIQVFMLALPHTYRSVDAKEGTIVKVSIPTEIGGQWYVLKSEDSWKFIEDIQSQPNAEVSIDPDIAWRLFSKSLRPKDVEGHIQISGNEKLGKVALEMISVMA